MSGRPSRKKRSVGLTKLKKEIQLLPASYREIPIDIIKKLKIIDGHLIELQTEIEGLETLTEYYENGKQSIRRPDPALQAYQKEQSLYNATVKTLMDYLKSVKMITGETGKAEDPIEKELNKMDEEFRE